MLPPPPSSTLFPYTTLFRSAIAFWVSFRPYVGIKISAQETGEIPDFRIGKEKFLRDRKSTRLNSSHRCTSYAVFCLKKKTPCPRARAFASREGRRRRGRRRA